VAYQLRPAEPCTVVGLEYTIEGAVYHHAAADVASKVGQIFQHVCIVTHAMLTAFAVHECAPLLHVM
jgi:hypothetical protein